MTIEQMAQEMVDAIAQIMSNRTINIMDKNAVIIASSDPQRIGTFHQGAAEALSSGKTICIYKNDIPHYEGAKEGINLPIVLDGKLFGVVGIYGDPDEVKDAANLLRVYVRQYFAQAALNRKEHMESELRLQLLRLLVLDYKGSLEDIHQLCALLGIKLSMPMRAIVISLSSDASGPLGRLKNLDKLFGILAAENLIIPGKDLYGIMDDRFILLKHMERNILPDAFVNQVHQTVCQGQKLEASTAIGGLCSQEDQLPRSYSEALTLAENIPGWSCMDDYKTRLDYLFIRLHQADTAGFSEEIYRKLKDHFGEQEIDGVMETILTHCQCAGSIGTSATRLHIHKNTMLYRMNRIYTVLGMEHEDDFVRRCFLKMLLVHHHRFQG